MTAETLSNVNATPLPEKKTKRLRKVLKIVLVLFLLGVLLIATLPLYSFLFISSITSTITTLTGRQSSIQSLSISLIGSKVYLGELRIKEENGTDDFIYLQKAEIDFSILPLISGNIHVPKIEISGVKTTLHKNASGSFNFDSILKHLSSKNSTTTTTPTPEKIPTEKTPLQKLPEILLNLQITDVQFTFIDDQNKQSVQVQDFGLSCTIDGLDKIQYSSTLNKAQYTSQKETPRSAELAYNLSGNVGISLDEGKWIVSASNKFLLNPVSLKGFGAQDVQNLQAELLYDLNLDLKKGILQIQKMGVTSDYLTVLLSKVHMSQLEKIQSESATWNQNSKEYTSIRKFLENMNVEDWKGNLDITLDLNQIQKTFGSYVAEASKKQLKNFGGKLQLVGSLQGKPNAVLEFSENMNFDQLHLSGELHGAAQENKPYKIALSEIKQHFKVHADFKKRQITSDFNWSVADDQKAQLLKIVNETHLHKLFEEQSLLQFNHLENKLSLDFGVLNHVLADFIPPKTSMKGTLENQDNLSYTAKDGLLMKGKTEVDLQVLSPETKDLPPLQIHGLRDLRIGFDAKNQIQQIQINQFNLDTQANKMLSVSGSGTLHLNETQEQSILLKLSVQLKELEPYLNPFLPNLKLDGKIQHQTTITKSQTGVDIQAEGHLDSFFVSIPEKLDYRIKETKWGSHIALRLKENLLETLQIKNTFFKHPALEIQINGDLLTQPELNIKNFKLETKVYAEALQKEVLTQLIARQEQGVQQQLTQDLLLNGHLELNVNLQGTPSQLSVQILADATPFVVEFKDPQKEVLFQKKPNYSLSYKTKINYTKNENNTRILVDSSSIQIGRVQILIGDLLYNLNEKKLSGPEGNGLVTLLDVQNFKLSEISEMLPTLKKMELEDTQIQFKLDGVSADLSKNDLRGKLFCRVLVPSVDLPKIQKSSKKETTAKTTEAIEKNTSPETEAIAKSPEKTEEEEPFKGIPESTRRLLEGVGIDVEMVIQKMVLNDLNQFTDFKMAVSLNKTNVDNQFHCLVQGKATSSSVDIQGLFDLSQEHPPCKFVYDIDQFPYIIEFFAPLSNRLSDTIKFPLAEKMRFADPAKVTFTLKGEDRWIGIDPRLIKKSLSSKTTLCKISGGTFDLGYDLLSFMDVQQLQKEIEGQVAPLKNTLKLLQGEQTSGLTKIKQIETAEAEIKKKIEELEKTRQTLLKTIDTLKPLAAFNPMTKSKLQEAEKQLKSYDTDLNNYKNQQNEMTGSLKKLQEQLAKLQKSIEETEAKIKKAQDDLMKNMKIENPFTFNFEGVSISMDITNEKPLVNVNEFKNSAFSRVNYIEFTFAPSSQNLLKIKGWYSLDGTYSFSFMPSEEHLATLSKTIPGLGTAIQKQGGILWTSEGFEPNPLSNKK